MKLLLKLINLLIAEPKNNIVVLRKTYYHPENVAVLLIIFFFVGIFLGASIQLFFEIIRNMIANAA